MSLLKTTDNRIETVQKSVLVNGMVAVQGKNRAGEPSGKTTFQHIKKKDYMASYKARHPGTSNKAAENAFNQYRTATLSEFNIELGQQIARGNIVADRISSDADGNLKTINLVKRTDAEKDKVAESITRVAAEAGMTVEEMKAFVIEQKKKAAAKLNDRPSIDVESSPSPEAPATQQGQPSEPSAPATSQPTEPQNIPAGQ